MLYVLKVTEDDEVYEYEYGNLRHVLDHYNKEETATVTEYYYGKEKVLVSKVCGKELTIQN